MKKEGFTKCVGFYWRLIPLPPCKMHFFSLFEFICFCCIMNGYGKIPKGILAEELLPLQNPNPVSLLIHQLARGSFIPQRPSDRQTVRERAREEEGKFLES